MTIIELDDKEAALFLSFRLNQGIFTDLLNAGLLTLRDGSLTVHVGHNGQTTIEKKHLTRGSTLFYTE